MRKLHQCPAKGLHVSCVVLCVCVCICKSALVEVVQCGACLIAGDLMDGASDKCLQSEKE